MQLQSYRYLSIIAMAYMTIKLITIVLIYKLCVIGPFVASASSLIIPLWFFLGDVIAEVYGYNAAQYLIWTAVILQLIFAFSCAGFIKAPSPDTFILQSAYDQVLGPFPKIAFASSLAILAGASLNAYAITKWKVLLRGKYFWLRSLGATFVGEAIFTVIAYVIEFAGVAPTLKIIHLIAISFAIKLLADPIAILPTALIASLLKKLEGLDIYKYEAKFRPFKLSQTS